MLRKSASGPEIIFLGRILEARMFNEQPRREQPVSTQTLPPVQDNEQNAQQTTENEITTPTAAPACRLHPGRNGEREHPRQLVDTGPCIAASYNLVKCMYF